jgi:hypothetical protein
MASKRLIQRLLVLLGIVACFELYAYANRTDETVSRQVHQHPPSLDVTHSLKENDLYLTLKVDGFSFSLDNMGKENRPGEGHVHLYLDGRKVAKIFEPQYVLKDIPAGHHEVVVELAHNNHESYGVKKSFHIAVKP